MKVLMLNGSCNPKGCTYTALTEVGKALSSQGIDYEIVPGVSSFTAAAAVLGSELTRPAVSQSVILTRVSGRASAVPERERQRVCCRVNSLYGP